MNKQAMMEWAGYLGSIAGLLILLLSFDRPGWMWQAGGAVLIVVGLVLIYRARRHRPCDDGPYDLYGDHIEEDVAEAMDRD